MMQTVSPWLTYSARGLLMLCLVSVCLCVSANPAYAVFDLTSCSAPGGFSPESMTAPIVYCIQDTIQQAVASGLNAISIYFQGTVAAGVILAVTIHGAKIMSGEREFAAKSIGFIIRIGLVLYFSFNLGGFAGHAFGVMDQLLTLAVGGYSPWQQIDDFLGTIFGFAPGIALFQGLIWLGAGLLSGTSSFGMSAGLLMALIEVIVFIIDVIYTYLTAYLVLGFMIILSPILIPTALFQYSERYFTKWLDTIIGAMLVPVFLFGFLKMSLGVFNTLICNVFVIMLPTYTCTVPLDPANPPDFNMFWRTNQPIFSWMMPTDPNFTNELKKKMATSGHKEKMVPPVQIVINPFDRGGFNANNFNTPGINFGLDNGKVNQKLLFALISLWIYASIMKDLCKKMPEVAQEIARAGSGIAFQSTNLKAKMNQIKQTVKEGGATIGGAALGGQAARAMSSNPRVIEAGALGGGILGNVLARKA